MKLPESNEEIEAFLKLHGWNPVIQELTFLSKWEAIYLALKLSAEMMPWDGRTFAEVVYENRVRQP